MAVKSLALLLLINWISAAFAQRAPIACQVEAAAGLNWENERWVTSRYSSEVRFVLVLDGKTLTPESAAKALGSSSATCRSVFDGRRIECSDEVGGHLEFSPAALRGTIAQLIGGTMDRRLGARDSIAVMPFACQRF